MIFPTNAVLLIALGVAKVPLSKMVPMDVSAPVCRIDIDRFDLNLLSRNWILNEFAKGSL
ncbi:MAG: hypothetical protein MZU97_04930 [Bacillus subtilis]|nr:hypothetical protein [Bacillus subtilis]